MRIQAIPVFNGFDIWQPYHHKDRIKSLSLYLVEAGSFDLFFNKRYNLCNGLFLQHLLWRPIIQASKHPSIINHI
ncbi:MAG: hypothetical protein ACKPKO_46390, partial [Candidatus Fonsibacter sp.]